MREIAAMAERIVKKAKEYDRDTVPGDYATLRTPCPNCDGVVRENYRRYACIGPVKAGAPSLAEAVPIGEGCGFSISKIPGGRAFEMEEVEQFLANKRIGPLEGFRSKAGWPFTAEIKLVFDDEIRNWKLEFDFGEDAKREGESGEPVDFSGQESLGPCPKTKGHVYEHGNSYVCEHAVGANVTCDFKSGKIILQQPIAREEMSKLLATGRTDLLENFVSNKTRRKFKARLAYDPKEGKVVFEFEPRAAKGPPGKRFGKAAAAPAGAAASRGADAADADAAGSPAPGGAEAELDAIASGGGEAGTTAGQAAPVKKTAARTATAKKTAAKKAPARKAPAAKTAGTKTAARKRS
jgi:DNA topoisomerase-3